MICSSPVIEVGDESKLDADNPLKLEYGFRMDNVSGVQNLTLNKAFTPFYLYPNPHFIPFDKEVKYYKSEYLNINVSCSIKTLFFQTNFNNQWVCPI